MSRASEAPRLRHPRYWPMWLGVAGMKALTRLPWSVRGALARALGDLVFSVVRFRRRIVLRNLRLCFPTMPEPARRRLGRDHYRSLALGIFETTAAWWGRDADLPRVTIRGGEHFEAARASGRGALLLTGHFTTLELCAHFLVAHHRFGVLYRDPNHPVVARLMREQRENQAEIAIHFDDLRGLVRALRAGHLIWYAPDQGKRTKMSELVPFFGEPAITNTATSRIAKMADCLVLPYFGRRLADGTYELEIFPPLENFPTDDPVADALRVNQLIEAAVQRAPDQYFWVHKRFKNRGDELPNVYA